MRDIDAVGKRMKTQALDEKRLEMARKKAEAAEAERQKDLEQQMML